MDLTDEQIVRYSRNIVLAELGPAGQDKIRKAKILLIGAGGLGSPAALYLTAAGIGVLGLVDCGSVELSNLQRQLLHDTRSLGREKTLSAAERLQALNPDVEIESHQERFTAANALTLMAGYDFVVDGLDNFSDKYLLNDACVLAGKPFSHAGVLAFRGQVMTVLPGRGPCLRCVMPVPPGPGETPTCEQSGVLGAVAGTLGSIQATEALKVVAGIGRPLVGRMLTYDALKARFVALEPVKNPECPVCSGSPEITELRAENYV